MVQAKQYGERVNVIKHVRVGLKRRFAAVVEKKGRVIRDHVWIGSRNPLSSKEPRRTGRQLQDAGDSGPTSGTRTGGKQV